MKTWTKEEYDKTVSDLYSEMKSNGFTKGDCVKEVKRVMKEEGITIKK